MAQLPKKIKVFQPDPRYLPNYKKKIEWIKNFASVRDTGESIQGTYKTQNKLC